VQRHKKLVIADLNKYIKKIPGADWCWNYYEIVEEPLCQNRIGINYTATNGAEGSGLLLEDSSRSMAYLQWNPDLVAELTNLWQFSMPITSSSCTISLQSFHWQAWVRFWPLKRYHPAKEGCTWSGIHIDWDDAQDE
jgi:hypothetical protein